METITLVAKSPAEVAYSELQLKLKRSLAEKLNVRIPYNPLKIKTYQKYWAIIDQKSGLSYFPDPPSGLKLVGFNEVPSCRPDCFYFIPEDECGDSYRP